MNVFSDDAIQELSHLGVKPFPILHVSEINKKQPMRPITLTFPMKEAMQSNEKLLIFREEDDKIENITECTWHKVEEDICTMKLNHFGVFAP